jgi:hypothetical protein
MLAGHGGRFHLLHDVMMQATRRLNSGTGACSKLIMAGACRLQGGRGQSYLVYSAQLQAKTALSCGVLT